MIPERIERVSMDELPKKTQVGGEMVSIEDRNLPTLRSDFRPGWGAAVNNPCQFAYTTDGRRVEKYLSFGWLERYFIEKEVR